ncbi:MAG TPA: cytochrome c biogenesis protein DipZ [Gammaproteobacteria bacterium]|nr:cytochrome c biogenesis protein DipZ [Gammaproteobacteria bacterium]
MESNIGNIFLALLEGFGLIISPCILPILPIILTGSLAGSRKHSLGIITGFVSAFTIFTFFSRQIVLIFSVDLSFVRNISYGLLILFGMVLLSTKLSNLFSRYTQSFANFGLVLSENKKKDFLDGTIFGGLIGLIWTPCAGPILATVIVQTVIQKTTWDSFFVVLAFGIGVAIPMLLIMLFGNKIMSRMQFFKTHSELMRKILGAVIIASVFYMLYGNSWNLSFKQSVNIHQNKLIDGLSLSYPAPTIQGINQWINSPPLTIQQLRGKVILIDFWTYSCINCIRTLPYLKNWYSKYHDKGFEIIGVHSPEFDFEKDFNNVKNAVKEQGITYPVALDNNFLTWKNFDNHYWPAHYLIDQNGFVVYQHFGEGKYDITENNIRFLLGLNKTNIQVSHPPSSFSETPETYLGYARMNSYASPESIAYDQPAIYTFPNKLNENQWALEGPWKVTSQKIISLDKNASIKIHFNARKIFVVMGSRNVFPIKVKILLNEHPLENGKGKDVTQSTIDVGKPTLYEVIVQDQLLNGILQMTATESGLEVYTFTFGE